jgi:integrase
LELFYRIFLGGQRPSRARTIPIADLLLGALNVAKARGKWTGPDDPVFVSRNGTPVDRVNVTARELKPVGIALGMPWLSWHCFRRTTATIADQLGAGTSDRKGLLGHGTDAMATHYVAPADLARRRALMEQIAATITPADAGKLQ